MCKAMEDRIENKALRIAYKLLKIGTISVEEIAEATELPLKKVKELAEQIKPNLYVFPDILCCNYNTIFLSFIKLHKSNRNI